MDRIDLLFGIVRRKNLAWGLLTGACTLVLGVAVRHGLPLSGFPFITFYPAVLLTSLVGGVLPGSGVAIAVLAYVWRASLQAGSGFVPANGAALGLAGGCFVFALEIGLIEMIRIAARRAHARQQTAERLLRERDAMFGELQHRVANNMQFIAGLFALQSRQLPQDGIAARALQEASDRLIQFARIHRMLHDAQTADRGFETLATDLLTDLLQATGCARIALHVRATATALPLDLMTTLILIVTEAATNAIKHVFTQSLGSRLAVTLACGADGEMELAITDDGPGFPPEPPEGRTSLGLKIIHALVTSIDGRMTTQSDGGATLRVLFPGQVSAALPVARQSQGQRMAGFSVRGSVMPRLSARR